MDVYSSQITNLVEQLSHLPGIGAKSAQRLAFHILNMTEEQVAGLSGAMMSAKKNVHYCKECCTYTDGEICPICANPKRNHRQIMVVENTRDLAAYEKTGKFDGVYHVLHGAISPMAGVGPDDIRLSELMVRLQKDVDEVVIPRQRISANWSSRLASKSAALPVVCLQVEIWNILMRSLCIVH